MQEPEAEAEAWQLGNQATWQLGDAGRKEQSAER
jgi:hypothetical protein